MRRLLLFLAVLALPVGAQQSHKGGIKYIPSALRVDCTDGQILAWTAATASWDCSAAAGVGDALVANPLSQFAATTSAQFFGVISDETGSGAVVGATSPTLVTPVLGVATATSINKVTITAPATGSTLTIDEGVTLTASASTTLGAYANTITNTANEAAFKTAANLEAGVDFQAYDADLDDLADGTLTGTKVGAFTGDAGAGGAVGAVPAPAAGDAAAGKFLKADATWAVPPGGSGATTALDNLAAVAINTTLVSDTAETDDLGSSAVPWKNLFLSENSATTNAPVDIATITANTSGTPANGLGPRVTYQSETSTTASSLIGRTWFAWGDVTHATRSSKWGLSQMLDATETTVLTVDMDAGVSNGIFLRGRTSTNTGMYSADDTDTGVYFSQGNAGLITFDTDNQSEMRVLSAALYSASTATYVYVRGIGLGTSPNSGFQDTQIIRDAAAELRIAGSGATPGLGYLRVGVPIEVNTTTKSAAITESGECYTNTGDGDGSTINLPNDPTIGTSICGLLTVSQTVTIVPAAGETISHAGTAYSTNCTLSSLGNAFDLVAATGGSGATWVFKSVTGTPTCS